MHDKSARIMNEFENADPQVVGQYIFQVPHMQQLAARHRRFHKGAGMLHIGDTVSKYETLRDNPLVATP